jgi:hypothetical protein
MTTRSLSSMIAAARSRRLPTFARCFTVPRSGPKSPPRSEALHLLSPSARDGKVMAQVALARELREGGEHDVVDWILNADR